MSIIDVYDDPGLSIFKELTAHIDKDTLMKTASSVKLLSTEEREVLRDDQFGLVFITKTGGVKKYFPLSDRNQVFMSGMYFMKTAGELNNAMQAIAGANISKAATAMDVPVNPAMHKIAEDFPSMGNTWVEGAKDFEYSMPSIQKVASTNNNVDSNKRFWGLTNIRNRYPLHEIDQVKVAAAYLDKNANSFTPEERFEFSCKVASRADEFGQLDSFMNPTIAKYAGVGFGSRFDENIAQRLNLCDEFKIDSSPFMTLHKQANQLGANNSCAAMIELDKAAGLHRYYDKSIDDPYAATHGGYITKVAEQSMTLGDTQVTESQIRSIPKETFIASYGPTLWNSIQSDPVSILSSLPKPDQAGIAAMIPSVGGGIDMSEAPVIQEVPSA